MFWYIVIGLSTILLIAIAVTVIPEHWLPSKQWAWFLLFSLFLFLFLAKFYWNVRKPRKFWALLFVVLAIHVLVYAPFLAYIDRAFWYFFIMPTEGMIIMMIMKRVFNIMPAPKTRL
jgi:hypothetical protein